MSRPPARPALLLGFLVLVLLWSCRREQPSGFDRNLPPETLLSGAPPESAASYYRVHLQWFGTDPDGYVAYYEYSVTDTSRAPGEDTPGTTGYTKTTRTDSTFVMAANRTQTLGHRFYVRAVDNEGRTDPTPAWTYFVADDFNLPAVDFLWAQGRWTAGDGTPMTVSVTSGDENSPTDTVGVGGSLAVSWGGHDVDDGDRVVGFLYRRTGESDYRGGSLTDTTASLSFARPAGSGLSEYYSGNAAVYVEAVDEAGARTRPPAVRSVVVNFSPRAWIVHPDAAGDPQPVSPPLFRETDHGHIYPSGTVLADGNRHIEIRFTGEDDHRDLRLDPNNPSGVTGFQMRWIRNGGGPAFKDIPGLPYPGTGLFTGAFTAHTSGDYTYLIRARDELGRTGPPDAKQPGVTAVVNFGVNYSPYFEWVRYLDAGGTEHPLWNPESPGDPVEVAVAPLPGGGYPDLQVRFQARDVHDPADPHPRDFNSLVEEESGTIAAYQVRLNLARTSFLDAVADPDGFYPDARTFPVSTKAKAGVVSPGINVLLLSTKDNGGRITALEVRFRAVLQ